MKKSFRKAAAAVLALTMVSACMPAFTTISTTVGGNAIVASAKEEIDTSKPFTLTFSLTGDTVVDADGRPVGKFQFMRYYRHTKNGVEVINLPVGYVDIYVNSYSSSYIGFILFTFTLNGIVHYENHLYKTDNFNIVSMYVPTDLNEFKITFTPKGYKSKTEKPTEPVIETQKPTEPVIETQKPTEPVIETEKPTEPVIETQEPIAPYIEEPTEEVQAGYTVILNSFGDSKLPVIKAVSVATGLTLKEAKDIVDNAPCTIKENVSEDEAKNIIIKVQEAGGTASANDLEIETIEETIQQTGITVTLDSFGASKLPVIKAIREAAGLTLREAKDIVDNAPCTIKENVSEDEAKNIIIKVQEAGGTASSKGLKTETVEETAVDETATEFTVTLDSFGNATVPVIKVVREITGLSLKEAKALVESAPCTLKENVSKEEAEDIINKIQTAGGTASKS